MQSKLNQANDWNTLQETGDCAELLTHIQSATEHIDIKEDTYLNLVDAQFLIYTNHQDKQQPLVTHYDKFSNLVEIIKRKGGTYSVSKKIVSRLIDNNALATRYTRDTPIPITEQEYAIIKMNAQVHKFILARQSTFLSKLI